ncbi:hypothetical protein SDC9_179195 [bioreactor metagenome]|uniref:Uncharacterized protein n=1 Tax=bioreactor metagenome TaxID=1076179 RepID=A0A645GXY8_9ZZZZ
MERIHHRFHLSMLLEFHRIQCFNRDRQGRFRCGPADGNRYDLILIGSSWRQVGFAELLCRHFGNRDAVPENPETGNLRPIRRILPLEADFAISRPFEFQVPRPVARFSGNEDDTAENGHAENEIAK